jgi:hypothetical protein
VSQSQQSSSRSHKVIQYYLDPEGNEKAPVNSEGNLILNFGTVLQGQSKRITLYAKNTIEYPIQLEPMIEKGEEDLKVSRFPPVLKAGDIQQVDIIFSPDPDRIKPLQAGFDFRKTILTRT